MKSFLNILLSFAILSSVIDQVQAQQEKTCGTEEVYQEALRSNPNLQYIRQALQQRTEEFLKKIPDQPASNIYIIPAVVHIIHTYGSENISKAQVVDAMRVINEDFQKLNSDTDQVVATFLGIATDSEVEFRLAQIDPSGNCTDGITRTNSALTHSAGENVKNLISWDNSKYLNIWVVDNISSGAGAYAYYPGTAQSGHEGIVNRNTQFGSIGTSYGSNFATRTLTHELGHYFNLAHTWGSSNSVNTPTSCFIDDWVGDTPNTVGSPQSCDVNRITCGTLDNVQNYMDYATCSKMFTEGQKLRMHAAINSSVGYRYDLWQADNLVATGTNDGYNSTCAPIADYYANPKVGCEGETIIFNDVSYNADVDSTWQWQWSFTGGTPSTSTVQNSSITYNTPGKYEVTLTVSNNSGSSSLTKSDYIIIRNDPGIYFAPIFESMEYASFPVHPYDSNKDWLIESESNKTWERTTVASVTGNASMRLDNKSIGRNEKNSLISPTINYSDTNLSNLDVTFKIAYARRNATSTDRLFMYISTNCGRTWALRYAKSGSALATNGGAYVTGEFIPADTMWREETVTLNSYIGQSSIMLKFTCISNKGNFLYLEDINVAGYPVSIDQPVIASPEVNIFPNPNNGDATIQYELNSEEPISFRLFDLLGKTIATRIIEKSQAGRHNFNLSVMTQGSITAGVYILQVKTPNAILNKQLIISK